MLTLRPFDETRTRLLYAHQMRRDFPPSELKELHTILNMQRAGRYDVLGAYDGGMMVAYALVYRPEEGGTLLLDYLAVEERARGRGYGTALLSALRAHYAASADVLLIECERPKAAPDEAQARKRIRFYVQAGAQLTNVRIWLFEVEYSILVLPCTGDLPAQDWAKRMLSLYRQMLPPAMYERNVRLIRG
ncbi:MAG: GNAT family N-acetyltransferase [Clostridia bacterium]|nr:GNAT family N-acetyltransferase [Clostridia bacterium]